MASTINASNTGFGGIVQTGDSSGSLALQAGGTTIATISSTGLTMNSGSIVQASTAAPTFSYYQSSNQTLSSGTLTKITFTTSEWDNTSGMYSSSRFTPTIAGYYQINAGVAAGVSAGNNYVTVYKNGALYKLGNQGGTAGNNTVSVLIYLNGSTDYAEIYASFATGQVTYANSAYTYFQCSMIRSA